MMAITKSNKHKLSLDQDKPNKKGGCTLATPYVLMMSLILDSQISITPLGFCSPLHSKDVSQLKNGQETSNGQVGYVFIPSIQNVTVEV